MRGAVVGLTSAGASSSAFVVLLLSFQDWAEGVEVFEFDGVLLVPVAVELLGVHAFIVAAGVSELHLLEYLRVLIVVGVLRIFISKLQLVSRDGALASDRRFILLTLKSLVIELLLLLVLLRGGKVILELDLGPHWRFY